MYLCAHSEAPNLAWFSDYGNGKERKKNYLAAFSCRLMAIRKVQLKNSLNCTNHAYMNAIVNVSFISMAFPFCFASVDSLSSRQAYSF